MRMMLRVKQSVTGCGGYTEFTFLHCDGSIVQGLAVPRAVEFFAEEMDDLLATQLISFIGDVQDLKPLRSSFF